MNTFNLKSGFPWWSKIIIKIILSRIPLGYQFWQSIGIFKHGNMDKADYSLEVFTQHTAQANLENNLAGKTLLELGPGDSIASAIIAKAYGAKMILVDTGKFASVELPIYHNLINKLQDNNLSPPSLEGITNLNELLECCDAQYLTNGVDSLRELKNASIDFIYSNAVLEHIRRHEFLDLLHECERILNTNGIASHQVDLRDHLGGGLNNLRFSKNIWESNFFANSGFYTNRIQFNSMINLFQRAKFSVSVINIDRWDTMPIARNKLALEFRSIDEQDLNVSSFAVLLSK